MKQQHRKQEVINQRLHRLPNVALERCETADQITAQNEGEIREQELDVVHAGENNSE